MNANRTIALLAVTQRGLEQARRLRTRLKTGEVHRPAHYGPASHTWEQTFAGSLAEVVPALFARCEQLVFFLATGAVTRLIAPCLVSKESDPGVLAVDEAGRFVVPVLSGHKGGANALARTVAGCLGATPVLTTASDVLGGLSPDLLAEAFGWSAEPTERLKPAALALVNQQPVAIVQELGYRGSWLDDQELPKHVTFARDVGPIAGQHFESVLWITDRRPQDLAGIAPESILWFRPKSLVLGVGCERGLSSAALEDGLEQFLHEHHYARDSIGTLATVTIKADEDALVELARQNDWETIFYSAEELAQVPDIPHPSAVVERCVGTPGVAEPAALLASGAARLLVEKQVVTSTLAPQRMTFALARLARFEERSAGRVVFIGAGPGDPELLTLKARHVLQRADVVVYAGSLVPEAVLKHARTSAMLHNSAHLTLEEVTQCLLDAARAGKTVARLQSGDTSLFSAIQEQMNLLDAADIDCEVIPGISSFQAAAAALKIELTLPELVQTVILTRGEGETRMPSGEALDELARHGSTLCIFLSARLCERVQEQLLSAYPSETPVAIVHRVSWPDELIVRTELKDLARTIRAHELTRTVLILVGAAVGREGERTRSRLYDQTHGHIFRVRRREETNPAT